jgi:hypothetical protein
MTPKLLFALSIIATVAVCALFLALEFQAAAWVLSAIGISAIVAAIGFIAAEAKEVPRNRWE